MNIGECIYIPEEIKEEVISKFTTTVEGVNGSDSGRCIIKVNPDAMVDYADIFKKYLGSDYSFIDDNTYLWMPTDNTLATEVTDTESDSFKGFTHNFLYVLPYIYMEEYFPTSFYDEHWKDKESEYSGNFEIRHGSESTSIDSDVLTKIFKNELSPEEAFKENNSVKV